MPTVVLFFSKLSAIASSVASSMRATTLGVARTGTSPDLKAIDRSFSSTFKKAVPRSPVLSSTSVRYAFIGLIL